MEVNDIEVSAYLGEALMFSFSGSESAFAPGRGCIAGSLEQQRRWCLVMQQAQTEETQISLAKR